jgi:hypothetical protein
MSVETQPDQQREAEAPPGRETAVSETPARQPLAQRIGTSFGNVEWRITLVVAVIMAVTWCALFLANNILQILAGVVPVMAGLYLGRRVKGDYLAHGLALGLVGFLVGLVVVSAYGALGDAGLVPMPTVALDSNQAPQTATFSELLFLYGTFSLFALIPFPAFGVVMSGRAEERNRSLREQVVQRGGRLERPGVVRTLEDLQGLSLPQFGSYVSNLYRKQGFEFKDYRFIDKDKHLDLDMTYNGELYLLRLSVADKVRPGTVESLVQELRRRDIGKGVAITSTEFTPDARKAADARRNLIAIDGATLFAMAEG